MAVYRTVHLSFWTDSKIDDCFTPEDKYFYLYLLTNPHTNICGCYEIGDRQFSRETGYNAETISRLIQRFQCIHNVIRYDPKTKEILILNWYKYNWTKSEDLLKSVRTVAAHIKSDEFKNYIFSLLRDSPETVPTPSPHPVGTSDTVTVSDVSVSDTVNNEKRIERENTNTDDDPVKQLFGYNEFLFEAVKDWLTYKKEKRQAYKGTGLKSFLTLVQTRVDEYGEDAVISVIRESMAANYQGITWDKLKPQAKTKNEQRTYTFADVYAEKEGANDKTGSFPDFDYHPN